MSKKITLSKDEKQIYLENLNRSYALKRMQSFLDWHNTLHYVEEITDIETAKEFLQDTKGYHEAKVMEYLKSKMPELPPNLKPVREMYNISDCEAVDFSDEYFDLLELTDGSLFYNPKVYEDIEKKHIRHATPEQERAIKELEKFYSILDVICSTMRYSDIRKKQIEEIIEVKVYYKKQDDPNLTRWDLKKLDSLISAGLGK